MRAAEERQQPGERTTRLTLQDHRGRVGVEHHAQRRGVDGRRAGFGTQPHGLTRLLYQLVEPMVQARRGQVADVAARGDRTARGVP